MRCKNCGEQMQGDRFIELVHCPNASDENAKTALRDDLNQIYCGEQPKKVVKNEQGK